MPHLSHHVGRVVFAINLWLWLPLLTPQGTYATPLDTSLEPPEISAKEVTGFFRDMVVVQRKAKTKAHHFLLATYGSFDFSDGPTTMYGGNLDAGYALSDDWEVYANYVPVFYAKDRDMVNRINSLVLADGAQAQLTFARPRAQYGVEILWAPAYGKDSWGPHSIVRSDTFFKLSAGIIQYDISSGSRYAACLGKTFFLSRLWNLRVSAGGSLVQSVIQGQRQSYGAGIIEGGLVWYL